MAKEKSTTELKDEKRKLADRQREIIAEAREAKRQFTAAEAEEMGAAQARMAEINIEIEENEALNRQRGTIHQLQQKEQFSLRRAIVAELNHQSHRDVEAAVFEEARKAHHTVSDSGSGILIPLESRAAFTAAKEAATGVVIDEEKKEMLLPLESALVLRQAGARMMTGLKGNIVWPEYSGSNVFWEGENTAAKDGAGTFSKGTVYTPKRLTAYVDLSKQLLIQENVSVEMYVRQTIATAIAQKVEKTALGNHEHSDTTPDGIFLNLPTSKGAMSWAGIVGMETDIDTQNALFGNLVYVMHPKLVGQAKTKVKDASGAGGFIFGSDGTGTLNGYRVLRTNNMPSGLQESADEYGIVFGNWADFFIGQWGAIEMTVDPYTQATKGMVRLVVNSYWNMGKVRDESFAIASMK